jgi:CRP-like cAMP-binding protein
MFHRHEPTIPASLRDSDLGRAVPASELARVVQMGTVIQFRSARAVIEEETVGRDCLIVIDGMFVVERDGSTIAELHAGDVAGEAALLSRQPRNATVTSSVGSSALVFTRGEFAALLRECPAVATHVRMVAESRLVPA